MAPKILIIPGSNRSGSSNAQLGFAAASAFVHLGAEVTNISLRDFPLPIFDEDDESSNGIPKNVYKLGYIIRAHDGVFLTSPEYNSSVSPLLKNMIDWVSRLSVENGKIFKPWQGKAIALGAASPGQLGGIRGLYHLRSILMNVGAHIVTQQVGVANAGKAFDDDHGLRDERSKIMLENTCSSLFEYCSYFNRF